MKESMNQENNQNTVSQYGIGKTILMFAWPAVWFAFLIYVLGRLFIPEGGTTPTWFLMTVIVLGTGAELVAGLVLLHREGYKLAISPLRERIRWQWPKGWKAWVLAGIVFILGLSLSMAMGPVNRTLDRYQGLYRPNGGQQQAIPQSRLAALQTCFLTYH